MNNIHFRTYEGYTAGMFLRDLYKELKKGGYSFDHKDYEKALKSLVLGDGPPESAVPEKQATRAPKKKKKSKKDDD